MENKPMQIAVVAGGNSSEREVSLKTARNILDNIDRNSYNAYLVDIRGANWEVIDHDGVRYPLNRHDFSWQPNGEIKKFDAVFNAIHGTPGENGKLQAYFDLLEIPYTGCDSFCSSLTFNKYFCNQFLKQAGIKAAASVMLTRDQMPDIPGIIEITGLPCVVKPNNGGSSCGSSKVYKAEELDQAIEKAFREDQQVIIEQFLSGPELTCGLMKINDELTVFPLTAIISKKDFFDYEAKYTPGLAEEITPAPVSEPIARSVQDLSVHIYQLLGCRGVVRMDYILVDNIPYFLEVNTIPGMTHESIVPRQAAAHGMSLTKLITALLSEASFR